MGFLRLLAPFSRFSAWTTFTVLLAFCDQTLAKNTSWIQYTGNDGTIWLDDDRKPALYTSAFGDCQGDSLINVTRFDAAYYKDNMTVLFHLAGNSALTNESLVLYIGVFAYGEPRFNLTFDPCSANINSLCPLNSSIPIEANGIIPVSQADVANIPSIALSIPDFEGQAILRIFANSTQSQIACFSAIVTNGATFSHPTAIGSILGIFAAVALISSVAVTVYGQNVSETRKHYAHSLSMLVVFSVYQHVFFTGGLSMNWPSVLVAFWSNYGWSAGMIYSQGMQNSINKFIGSNRGNISMVGSAPSGQNAVGLGGGYEISQIYKRAALLPFELYDGMAPSLMPRDIYRHTLARRELANSTSGFSWYGLPVLPGLPLPGNYSGFAGTLAELNIPASNGFLTGLIWFLIFVAIAAGTMIILKWSIEALVALKWIRTTRLEFFRRHWLGFTAAIVLRTFFIGFFMMMFLALFQFTLGGSSGVRAIAGVVFATFLLGNMGIAAYALYYRLRHGKFVHEEPARVNEESKGKGLESSVDDSQQSSARSESVATPTPKSHSWWPLHFQDHDVGRPHVHDDEDYITKFGWLSSRFRRSKWWFFAFWLVYELGRACFYGGAAGHALTQVFGLLVWEILAFVAIILMKPFESNRLNLIMVYLLGFSKVATVALSAAFDARFHLDRILTTVIGVVIIVIQGLLTICLMIAVVIGAISSYMSITRYQEEIKPRSWLPRRTKYFLHIDQKSTDQPIPRAPKPVPELPKEPYFNITSIRRQPKIEDEDVENENMDEAADKRASFNPQSEAQGHHYESRTQSMRSRTSASNLPYGARRHRLSWSTRDFQDMEAERELVPSGIHSRMSIEEIRDTPSRHRTSTMRSSSPNRISSRPLSSTSNGSDFAIPKSRPQYSTSSPMKPKRNSSIVNEEQEYEFRHHM